MPTNAAKQSTVAIKPVRVAGSERLTYVAVRVDSEPWPVRWLFLLFVFSIPFEAQDLDVLSGLLSPARIFGTLFFAAYVLYHNAFFARRPLPPMPTPVRWFLFFLAVFTVARYVFTGSILGVLIPLMTFAQLFVFLWVACDMLRDKRLAIQALLIFAFGVTVLAASMIFGIGGLSHQVAGRTAVLEEDLNALAVNMGIALLIFVGLCFSAALQGVWLRALLGATAILPLLAIAQTGSRGGVASLVAGLIVFATPYARRKVRWGPALIALCMIALSGYVVATNADFLSRIHQTYDEGSLAGREQLFPTALEMISERPLFGWQGEAWLYEVRIGSREGAADPHNLFLHLLLHLGLVGTIPYVVALSLCGIWAWRSRGEVFGFLPMTLFITVMIAGLSLSTTTWKPLWLTLALAVASGEGIRETRRVSRTAVRTHRGEVSAATAS